MRAIESAELLDIWERYQHLPLLERSLQLLAALYQVDVSDVAALSIGDRDVRLLVFRTRIFGNRLNNTAECPACKGKVEWEMQTEALRLQPFGASAPLVHEWRADGYQVRFRLPTSSDLLRAMQAPDAANPTRFLTACILGAESDGTAIDASQLPATALEAIAAQMSEQDPQADIQMEVRCPECGHEWKADFDIMRYLWLEIDSWARRLVGEIALLARAFGWNETEILRLSPRRRRTYLELVAPR